MQTNVEEKVYNRFSREENLKEKPVGYIIKKNHLFAVWKDGSKFSIGVWKKDHLTGKVKLHSYWL